MEYHRRNDYCPLKECKDAADGMSEDQGVEEGMWKEEDQMVVE